MMNDSTENKIALPALRGIMGDWIFYSCLMNLKELSSRVNYAKELHTSDNLSDMIQRELKKGRSIEIVKYLKNQKERFFNSLVIAVYDGQPNWYSLSDVRNKYDTDNELKETLTEEAISSIGFLMLTGEEKLFALDGQHRLAGIKQAVQDITTGNLSDDEVSVIFVSHKNNKKGLERTRRLFTTLNKTAKPVSKGEIIALDEDDVLAICVRRLVEHSDLFKDPKIAFVADANMPTSNVTSLTTIVNLYDVLKILFTVADSELQKPKAKLQRIRPNDEDIEKYFHFAESYFNNLRKNFNALDEFFSADDTEPVIKKFRGSHGGHVLFRPVGLETITTIVAKLTKYMSMPNAVKMAAKLPYNLDEEPYKWLMWEPRQKKMVNAHKPTVREILLYMVKKNSPKHTEASLLNKYRTITGDDKAKLPQQLI